MPQITLPFSMSILQLVGLCTVSFCAGFIDSIAGGGGLVQLPGVMACLPTVPVVQLLAVNKTSSMFGTCTSMYEYWRKGLISFKRMWKSVLCAFFHLRFRRFYGKKGPE